MYRRPTFLLLIPALMLVVFGSAEASQAGGERKTVWDGIYTEAQAVSGRAVYEQWCGSCHGPTLGGGANQGAPVLKGAKFMDAWREDNLESFYLKTKNTMPRRSEKTLTEKETIDVVSFILAENGFPAGGELKADVLGSIQIQRKEGPAPLPNNSLIHTVGCLVPDGTNWMLSNSGAPVRVRSTEPTTPEELKAAQARPLGERTLRLSNLLMLGDFKPEEHKGHKMLAKGLLSRRTSGETLSVTGLEMVAGNCPQ